MLSLMENMLSGRKHASVSLEENMFSLEENMLGLKENILRDEKNILTGGKRVLCLKEISNYLGVHCVQPA